MKDLRSENLYWIWLSLRLSKGSPWLLPLLEHFATPFAIYSAQEDEFASFAKMRATTVKALCDKRLDDAYAVLDACAAQKIGVLTYGDEAYPKRLKQLKDPPVVLYYRGRLPDFDNRLCLAVVGTRKMTEYGKQSAFRLSRDIAQAGGIVVSGMASGIDGVAACGALAAGGITVAVFGCGVDVVYPPENTGLMNAILREGAVISEFAPGTPPERSYFPLRNRIISGLCQGTLVIEANKRSGALITAQNALVQGRDLYALPANVGSDNSYGTNALLRDGATLVLEANDILRRYDFLYAEVIDRMRRSSSPYAGLGCDDMLIRMNMLSRDRFRRPRATRPSSDSVPKTEPVVCDEPKPAVTNVPADLDDKHKAVLEAIPLDRAVSMDKLMRGGYAIHELLPVLVDLEVKGLINALPGGLYIRR